MIILIPTQIRDVHALVVDLVLSNRGHDVYRWFTADLPLKQTLTHKLTANENELHVRGKKINFREFNPEVIWLRRPSKPYLEDEKLCRSDYLFAEEECSYFYKYQWDSIGHASTWINPYHSHLKANNKILQLITAKQCGFYIPNTLVTNDYDYIKEFIRLTKKIINKLFIKHSDNIRGPLEIIKWRY